MAANISTSLEGPVFSERWWLPPIYSLSATFVLDGVGLIPERLSQDMQSLYEATLRNRVRRWPRILTQFFLVPVYCAPTFPKDTVKWLMVHNAGLGRLGVLFKPVLYNVTNNTIEFREAIQNGNLDYYKHLSSLFAEGISKAAKHHGQKPESITMPGNLS